MQEKKGIERGGEREEVRVSFIEKNERIGGQKGCKGRR